MMRRFRFVLIGLLMMGMAACSKHSRSGQKPGNSHSKRKRLQGKYVMQNATLIDILSHRKRVSKFAMALRAADLVQYLQQNALFTVFAPTNSAFDALPAKEFNRLMNRAGKEDLSRIVKYHIVKKPVHQSQLKNGTILPTAEGDSLRITRKNGNIFVNGAKIVKGSVKVSNGIIYYIHKVLMPPH
ncbi:MAG TPA: fasciclin domain-containing protein [Balneolaceae bacterium]|nr:fasciclin domain-containing protein [Balneolaceae bacterium]